MKCFSCIRLLVIVFLLSSALLYGQTPRGGAEAILQADIEGIVFDGSGIPVSGAIVGILDGITTISDASGYYLLSPDLTAAGYVNMYCYREGYNYEYFPSVWATPGSVTNQDMVLTIPNIYVSPTLYEYTLNPGEYFSTPTGMTNTGDGKLSWTADVIYTATDGGNRDIFECSPASVFGNPPTGYTLSHISKENGTYQQYQEITGISGSWNTVSFWGTLEEVIPYSYIDFIIEIYASGSNPGMLLATYSAYIPPIPTAELLNGYPVYFFETTIDEQSLSDCWIKITSTGTSETFCWLNAPFGTGGAQAWQGNNPAGSHEPLAICLSNELEDWCTLDWYAGINPGFGYIENIPTNFNASGKTPGETYTCDLVFTSHPDYGSVTIPIEMTVEDDDPLIPVSNLSAILIDDITGCFYVSWDWVTDLTFQFFLVKRDGIPIATSTSLSTTDCPPDYGTHCYTVQACYDEGYSTPVTTCEEWLAPEIFVEPMIIRDTLFPGSTTQNDLIVSDTGLGSLYYYFPDFPIDANPPCWHEVAMYDDYGDGWNDGYLSVFVDGVKVLDSITLLAGSGPEYAFFEAETGQEITSVFVCGGYCDECYYEIIDGNDNTIATDGAGGVDPTGIPAGACYTGCPLYFITDVSPNNVTVAPFESSTSTISWDAVGYGPGTYYDDLILESNDPSNPVITIQNIMDVLPPGYVSGSVTSSTPPYDTLIGVRISSTQSDTITTADGKYNLPVPAKSFDLVFEKPGYQTLTIPLSATSGNTITYDAVMMPECYPPLYVYATVNYPDEDWCLVEWGLPTGPEEIIYDDGIAEDYYAWPTAYNESAVRFTPSGYPCFVNSVSIYVGDGSFGSSWLGSQLAVLVYNEGPGGMPGDLIDSIGVIVNNFDWIEITGLNDSISEGDIFISVMQLNPIPNTPPIGIDMTIPLENRSYIRPSGGSWSLSSTQDFMIRAVLEQPTTLNPPDYYTVFRISDFDPVAGPETGTHTALDNSVGTEYMDMAFSGLPTGWYAYAVYTNCDNGCVSPLAYSKTVGHGMYNNVTFIVSDCILGPGEGFEVTAVGQDWPFEELSGVTDVNGICELELWTGNWDITISKCGYLDHEVTLYVDQDMFYEIIMDNILYAPRDLYVDTLTGTASWNEPKITALYDDFDKGDFYSKGWQMTSNGIGWVQTDDGGSMGFFITPDNSTTYMCVNDDAAGTGNDGCCDMLITPNLELCESDNYVLNFDSYFTGVLGQTATVEYSTDAGQNWTVLYTLSPAAGAWQHIEIDLAAFSGANAYDSICFAFHADDGGGVASGWAIDNVDINAGPTNPNSYFVYLDGVYISTTDTSNFQYSYLNYGQVYQSGVAAEYDCGLSDEVYSFFTSGYLAPPSVLEADSAGMNVELYWVYDTASIQGVMPDVLGFNLYRDSISIAYIPYTGQDTSFYTDVAPVPMCYDYHVSTLYDLSLYTFPGDTGESFYTGPEEVCLVYGTTLPYFQDWSSGSFEPDWTAGDNWRINGQYGNPNPAAEFTWVPVLTNYEECLVSGYFNGMFKETKSIPYEDGQFILSFDLLLDNVNSTGNEFLKVEIGSEGVWNEVASYNNADGSFYWELKEVDITNYSMGHVFKIRFLATGEESSDILSWLVDNIEVYHSCFPPENLVVEPDWNNYMNAILTWSPPDTNQFDSEWIYWDDGTYVGGIGLTGGGTFSYASHWDPDMIAQYDGFSISKIRFVPGIQVVETDYILKVWEGPNAGTLLYKDTLTGLIPGNWNEVTLTSPIEIDVTQELWCGLTVVSADGDFPAGYDGGPAVAGYGDMIRLDGSTWDPISSFGAQFDVNWNLQAFITEFNKEPEVKQKDVLGYNIYLDKSSGGGYEFLDYTEDTFYYYEYTSEAIYFFYVTALYASCESGASNVVYYIIGIDEVEQMEDILIYPNPTNSQLTIHSEQAMQKITLHDLSGRIIQTYQPAEEYEYTMDVSSNEAGVYLLRVDTEQGQHTRKIIID